MNKMFYHKIKVYKKVLMIMMEKVKKNLKLKNKLHLEVFYLEEIHGFLKRYKYNNLERIKVEALKL